MKNKYGIIAAVVIVAVILIGVSVYFAITSSHEKDEIESTSGTVLGTQGTIEPETEETKQAESQQEETTTREVSTTVKSTAKAVTKSVTQTEAAEITTTTTTTTTTTAPDTTDKMTMAQFDRLQKGMTYEQVLEIAGMPPKSIEEINGEVIYHWDAEGALFSNGKPPVATVQFQNGRVSSKICLRVTPKKSN